jgi:cytochrome c5
MKTFVTAITMGVLLGVSGSVLADGQTTYQTYCQACHNTGAANAPKLGDKAAWEPRIAAGMDAMMANATNGMNAMPPKGTCMSCSDDDLKAVVDYMVSQVQ